MRLPDVAALNAAAIVILLAEAAAVLEPFRDRRGEFRRGRAGAARPGPADPGHRLHSGAAAAAAHARGNSRASGGKPIASSRRPRRWPRRASATDTVRLGGREENVRMATTRLVRGINALGWPALSIPCGATAAGLPVGMQIVGPAYHEAVVLCVGAALEAC